MRSSRIFILPTIAFLLTSTKLMIDSILAIYLYEHLGASESEVGVIISLGYVSSLIVKVPLGLHASMQ